MPRLEPTHEPPLANVYVRDRSWGDDTLWSAFSTTAARAGNRTALVEDEARLGFDALAVRAEALAARFATLGVVPGDVVALQLPNWWETVVVLLATAPASSSPRRARCRTACTCSR